MGPYWWAVSTESFYSSLRVIGWNLPTAIYALLVVIGVALLIRKFEGVAEFRKHIVQNVLYCAGAAIVAWIPFFMYHFVRTPSQMDSERQEKIKGLEQDVADLKTTIDSRLPKLRATIEQIAVGQPAALPDHASIFLLVSVVNTGAPSIADKWKLTVEFNDQKFTPRPTFQSQPITLTHADGSEVTYPIGQALYDVSVKEPIATGGRIIGALFFLVPINFRTAQKAQQKKYRLTFEDVWGTEYEAENRATTKGGPLFFYPGSKLNVKKKTKKSK